MSARPNRSREDSTATRLGLLVVLGVLVVLFSLLSDYFFSAVTFRTLLNQVPPLVLVSVGMTFVLVTAQIDLSVGSVLAFSGAVFGALVLDASLPVLPAAALAIVCALLCGGLTGAIVVRWSIPSFIVTLGMLEIARGGSYLVTGSQTKYLGDRVAALGAPIPGLGLSPSVLIAVAVVVVGQLLLRRTVLGRTMIAVGTNEEAVRIAGVNARRVKWIVFSIVAGLSGLAGIMQVSYLQSADPNAGFGLELAAIAAVVIGGTSLMGGRGSVISSFFGVLIIAVLQTGLAQVGASEPTKRIVTGAVIVIAVIADVHRRRLDGRQFLRRLFSRGS